MTNESPAFTPGEVTIPAMASKKRSPVVAWFEIESDPGPDIDPYQLTITVTGRGRMRSVLDVSCEREEFVQEWIGDEAPTLEDIADILLGACNDSFHVAHERLLAAVVHGLLPQAGQVTAETAEIPDAFFDPRFGFGARTTYHVALQRKLVEVLRSKPATAWALQVQIPGTDEYTELADRVEEVRTADPEWLLRATEASRMGVGTPFDDLVAKANQERLQC